MQLQSGFFRSIRFAYASVKKRPWRRGSSVENIIAVAAVFSGIAQLSMRLCMMLHLRKRRRCPSHHRVVDVAAPSAYELALATATAAELWCATSAVVFAPAATGCTVCLAVAWLVTTATTAVRSNVWRRGFDQAWVGKGRRWRAGTQRSSSMLHSRRSTAVNPRRSRLMRRRSSLGCG